MKESNAHDSTRLKTMHLQVLLPTEILVDEAVTKIVAESDDGSFCLLPRHIDYVASLVPGVLCFSTAEGAEGFAGIDEGILVKFGNNVSISTRNGVRGSSLDTLKDLIESRFTELDDQERKARSALARLEGGALRGFLDLTEKSHD